MMKRLQEDWTIICFEVDDQVPEYHVPISVIGLIQTEFKYEEWTEYQQDSLET